MAAARDRSAGREREAAERIVRMLQARGHEAYFAGGCVRDQLMGHEPSDYDVATDAKPEVVLEVFDKAWYVGEAFGVVMVRMRGVMVEVATFRKEWGYADHRRPDHVAFCDAAHDAGRRDFTMNGLFYDPVADAVIDYVEGQRDIARRIVRAIGEPQQRFEEDYLRMLRAVRFAAKLGFTIDPATAEAIKTYASQLAEISRERIGQEVQAMLEHASRAEAVRLMQQLHLDAPALHESTSEREPITVQAVGAGAAYATVLAAWAIDRRLEPHRPPSRVALIDALDRIKHVQLRRNWRAALVLSNEVRDAFGELLALLPEALMWGDLDSAKRKRLAARASWAELRRLMGASSALVAGGALDLAAFEGEVAALEAEGVSPTPLLTGDDLIAAGFEPGPMFGRILERVYDAQLNGEVGTPAAALALARSLAAQED